MPIGEGKTSKTCRNSSSFAYTGMEVGTHHHGLCCRLPRTQISHDAIWVIVDRLTKSVHFLAIRSTFFLEIGQTVHQ